MRKMSRETKKMKDEIDRLKDKVGHLENKIQELEHLSEELYSMMNQSHLIMELVSAWNDKFPKEWILLPRRNRPSSDYAMTDEEWEAAIEFPKPVPKKKGFNPETGAFE